MSVVLKVKPAVLRQKAEAVQTTLSGIGTDLSRLDETVMGTDAVWQGEAADGIRGFYSSCREELLAILEKMRERPSDLLQMADTYEAAEQESENEVDMLL